MRWFLAAAMLFFPVTALAAAPPEALADSFIKGGSEPGVISMTLLLRGKQSGTKVLTASWNNEEAPVDEGVFVSLVNRAVELLAP